MRLSRLAPPGYAVCLWLVVFPFVDAFALALPPAPMQAEWRYSLTELLSRSLMTPMLGAFGWVVLSSVFEHEGMRRLMATLAGLGAAVLVLLLGLFALDSVALLGVTRRGLAPVFGGPWIAAVVKLTLAIGVLLLLARTGRGDPARGGRDETLPPSPGGPDSLRRPLGAS